MNGKHSFAYALSANLLSTLVSALIALLLPKVVSVESFGYFQYFLFWAGYLGILHLGWIDGLYLVHCGEYYRSLHKDEISAQIRTFFIFQLALSACIVLFGQLCIVSEEYRFICTSIGLLLTITNCRLFLLYILQATARIKEYSISTIAGLAIYIIIITILMLRGVGNFHYYVIANIISNIVPLLIGCYYCLDILMSKPAALRSALSQAKTYIGIGSQLLIANFASAWIIGVVRIMIERHWDIATFGKISLTITISNMFMTFINAIALVLLPMLRRMEEERLAPIYGYLNDLLLTAVFGGMLLYFPFQQLLMVWLPEYAESLKYMSILLPICVFESKNAMICNTYLKALRKEKAIMLINVGAVAISAILSFVAISCFRNLTLSMIFIVIAIGMRCILFEVYLSKTMNVVVHKHITVEVLLSIIFIICNWNIGGMIGLLIYIVSYIIYILVIRREISLAYDKLIRH